MEPSFALARYNLAQCYGMFGQYHKAIPELQRAAQDSGNSVFVLSYMGYVHAEVGNNDEAHRLLDQLKALHQQGAVICSFIADIYIGLGNKTQALNWMAKAVDEHAFYNLVLDHWVSRILGSDLLDGDPRYEELLKRQGIRD